MTSLVLILALALAPPPAQVSSSEGQPGGRTVRYGAKDVVLVKSRVRFTTMIVLPAAERILDFVCGDKELWIVNGNQNLAYIKPAKSGTRTNLNLVTESGNVYSFLLTEISDAHGIEPDLKVYVELEDSSMVAAADGVPAFVSARQIDDYKAQLDLTKHQSQQAIERAQADGTQAIERFRASYPLKLQFPYRFAANLKPFFVSAIYTDGSFTFIRARFEELPALYELKDGNPSLVSYDYKDGVLVAGKVLDSGYLAIGRKRWAFRRGQ